MKKIIILVLLTLNSFANLSANEPISTPILLEFQAVKSQQQLQKLSINNLKEQLLNSDKYYALRQDVLNSQELSITWWLSAISIFLAVFGVFGFVIAKGKIKEFDDINKEVEGKIKEFNRLNAEAENELNKIKNSSKQAKAYEESTKLSAETAKKLNNPKVKITAKDSAEIKKYGSRVDKIIEKIHKLNSERKYEEAIVLCNEAIIIAKYEKDKKQLSVGYFYLGYIYGQLKQYKQAINAYKQAINIKPDNHIAYYNMGVAYYNLEQYQQAINAYKQAIKIKPDYADAYHNMNIAESELAKLTKNKN
jgi:tetratricopeptide (TPR) repeat protein